MKMDSKKIGYILLILSIILLVFKIIIIEKDKIIESNKIENTILNATGYLNKNIEDIYDAVLSIPYINLKKGIYDKNDKRNNVDENITIHKLSDYPDLDNSNLILMAHSGIGRNAYFNDLDKLNTDSLIEFYYLNTKYVYKIDNYYTVNKTGTATIKRDINKKTITLITCSQKDKTKQLIYIGYLIDEIHY